MPPRITLSIEHQPGPKSRRRRTRPSSFAKLAFLATTAAATTCCLLRHNPISLLIPPVHGEPTHSTIPRSNNRYTHYNTGGTSSSESASDVSTLSSPSLNSYHPPWNPSPKIDPGGFLSDRYPRSPGEWEVLANIRGKHGPRNQRAYAKTLNVPVQIRQVPGDGNCLFHSIAACLHHAVNGTHLPMDSYPSIGALRSRSLRLRNSAVDVLENAQHKGRRRLFLQGEEYLEAEELLTAAAAQFDLAGEEYCELMRKESYWGGGPEIVALCNYLQRPIHIYELIPSGEASNHLLETNNNNNNNPCNLKTSSQFTLRRMACFGSPKFDRREPLHILSADSRFPDIEPRRIRKVGNHFLALFPVNTLNNVKEENAGEVVNQIKFRRHALIRGGSRILDGNNRDAAASATPRDGNKNRRYARSGEVDDSNNKSVSHGKWDGGLGTWKSSIMDFFV